MSLVIGIIGLIISIVIIYFSIPYSRLKANFKDYLVKSEKQTSIHEKDIKYALNDLPQCMQNFYRYTGLMNKINSKHVSFNIKNADFVNIEMKKTLKIDYSEHIFADVPARFAFINSSMFSIPFQGLDSFIDGKGGMKGVVAKNITIFNQRGDAMNKSAFVTWLSEIVFMPSQLLNGEVKIKEIDRNTVYVEITYYDMTISGKYRFLDNGQLVEFTTDDRSMIFNNGKVQNKKWTVIYEDYVDKGGLRLPNRLKSEWHLENEDLVYFDGSNVEYKFYE